MEANARKKEGYKDTDGFKTAIHFRCGGSVSEGENRGKKFCNNFYCIVCWL